MSKQKINKLLIGTINKGKLSEIKSLLPKSIKIHSTSEFNLKSPIENGKTFKENSAEEDKQETGQELKEEIKEPTLEEKIAELEDKVARTFAEMENQRRRFEKEKEDAFEYGGYSFAKEALNLIDNLDRSKLSIKFNASLAKL